MNIYIYILTALILSVLLLKQIIEFATKGAYSVRMYQCFVGVIFLFLYITSISSFEVHKMNITQWTINIAAILFFVFIFKSIIYKKNNS